MSNIPKDYKPLDFRVSDWSCLYSDAIMMAIIYNCHKGTFFFCFSLDTTCLDNKMTSGDNSG